MKTYVHLDPQQRCTPGPLHRHLRSLYLKPDSDIRSEIRSKDRRQRALADHPEERTYSLYAQ